MTSDWKDWSISTIGHSSQLDGAVCKKLKHHTQTKRVQLESEEDGKTTVDAELRSMAENYINWQWVGGLRTMSCISGSRNGRQLMHNWDKLAVHYSLDSAKKLEMMLIYSLLWDVGKQKKYTRK